jgi:hypothetical protein
MEQQIAVFSLQEILWLRGQLLYNNLNEYGIPMTLDIIIKMCQNYISSEVFTDKYRVQKKKKAGISGTCILQTKTDMRVLFAVLYSWTETFSLYISGKVLRCETLHNERHL